MSASSNSGDSSGSSSGEVRSSANDNSCVDAPTGVLGKMFQISRSNVVVFDSNLGENRRGLVEGSVPVYLLRDRNLKSIVTFEDLSEFRATYDFPSCINLASPSDLERPDWYYSDWAVMYECFFKMDARFPLSRLVLEACDYYNIAPSQLVPNAWRTLMAIQVFSELRNVHFSFCEVLLAYNLEVHRFDKVRYLLKASRPLVLSSKDSPKEWSHKYFFVSYNTLGVTRGQIVPGSWEPCSCLKKVPSILSKDSFTKIEWFLNFDEEERTFSAILTEANLRASSLWSHVSADHKMSKPFKPSKPLLLGQGAAMEKFRNRKKAAASSSDLRLEGVANVLPSSPIQTRKKEKRLAQVDLPDEHGESIRLSFPNVAAHSEFINVRGTAENLLFPDDRDILEGMGDGVVVSALFDQSFLAMQKAIFLKEMTLAMAAELKELKAEKANWGKEMKVVKKAHDEANQIIEKLKAAKLDDTRQAAADCHALQEKVKQLGVQVEDVSCDTEIITRGIMAEEFLRIKPPQTWDVTRYLAEFEEWKGENPDWVARFERQRNEQDKELATNFAEMST